MYDVRICMRLCYLLGGIVSTRTKILQEFLGELSFPFIQFLFIVN